MNNKKRTIYTVTGIVLASILLFIGIMCVEINGDKIAKNTYINNVNIGGLTKTEAIEKLDKEFKAEEIELTYQDKAWKIEPSTVDFSYNTKESAENGYKITRNGNFFENLIETIKTKFSKENKLNIISEYNDKKLKLEIENIAKEIDVEVEDASISISGSNINIKDEIEGTKVNIEETIKSIEKEVKKGNLKGELIVKSVEPKIKKEKLQEVNTLLGSYSTKVTGPVTGRHTNIRLATERTSDVLLMPGETFSYNEQTGLRSAENGYKNAPVIVQGVLQEGLGGGVCQVSSTLYNATLYAGLEYVELKNHSIPSGYVDMGRDAVVSDTGLDFVFKNNLTYPIYVKNYMSGSTIVCQIYGSAKDKQNISISTNTDKVVEAPIKKVDDPTINKGEEKVLEKGRNAYTVSTYRIYKDNNGKAIRQEKVYTSYYPKRQGVVAVGTKVIEPVIPEVPVEPDVPVVPEVPQTPTTQVPPTSDGANPSESSPKPQQ